MTQQKKTTQEDQLKEFVRQAEVAQAIITHACSTMMLERKIELGAVASGATTSIVDLIVAAAIEQTSDVDKAKQEAQKWIDHLVLDMKARVDEVADEIGKLNSDPSKIQELIPVVFEKIKGLLK